MEASAIGEVMAPPARPRGLPKHGVNIHSRDLSLSQAHLDLISNVYKSGECLSVFGLLHALFFSS